jgi:hypothetical protein
MINVMKHFCHIIKIRTSELYIYDTPHFSRIQIFLARLHFKHLMRGGSAEGNGHNKIKKIALIPFHSNIVSCGDKASLNSADRLSPDGCNLLLRKCPRKEQNGSNASSSGNDRGTFFVESSWWALIILIEAYINEGWHCVC